MKTKKVKPQWHKICDLMPSDSEHVLTIIDGLKTICWFEESTDQFFTYDGEIVKPDLWAYVVWPEVQQ